MIDKLPPLVIGDLEIKNPIVQGAMGIRVSTHPLVSAVANAGAAGTIASVALGFGNKENETNFLKASTDALEYEIREVKKSSNGVFGVNIMVALSNYEDLARTASREKVDYIVSGAGLPLKLPEYVDDPSIKLLPIVSSARAADLIAKTWEKRYDRLPDGIVVEGPKAGGHLGFKNEEIVSAEPDALEKITAEVIEVANNYGSKNGHKIPVIPGGGIFDGKDVARFFRLGAKGVQIASRFVTTYECSVSEEFKKLYLQATEDDILIIQSPVGMPGRAIRNEFIEKLLKDGRHPFICKYKCLKTCNPKTSPYCIAKALHSAATGKIEEAVVFAGSNVSRINKIVHVQELIDEIIGEAIEELNR
ncbi:MAG: nitronate monooxygenase family protein [Firmicutes bacterium]|nr:nitronate monooxygenase family protein [Bacillota bacterium]